MPQPQNPDAVRARQFDLIAFDWDGTLFDSTAIITRCIQLAVRDVGGTVPSDKEAAYVIGMGLMQALAHAAPDVPASRYAELGVRYRFHYMARQSDIVLFDGVLSLLADLKARHHLLAVATGKSRRGLDEAELGAEHRLPLGDDRQLAHHPLAEQVGIRIAEVVEEDGLGGRAFHGETDSGAQPWISQPSAARAASITASDIVGWPWTRWASSG